MNIARVIDFETTGTPEDEGAEVIELGRIDVDMDTREVLPLTAWRSFAMPQRPIPPVAKAVHHITEDDMLGAPPIGDLWEPFFEGTDILVAHYAKFEKHFSPHVGGEWIDTYKVARVVWPDAPAHSNQALRYWLNLELDRQRASPPHRALPDAYVTANLFVRLLAEKTPEEMIQISKYPALLRRITFGTKAKGQTYEEAPLDYLTWIRDKSELDEDTKFSAKYWVSKRTAKS